MVKKMYNNLVNIKNMKLLTVTDNLLCVDEK